MLKWFVCKCSLYKVQIMNAQWVGRCFYFIYSNVCFSEIINWFRLNLLLGFYREMCGRTLFLFHIGRNFQDFLNQTSQITQKNWQKRTCDKSYKPCIWKNFLMFYEITQNKHHHHQHHNLIFCLFRPPEQYVGMSSLNVDFLCCIVSLGYMLTFSFRIRLPSVHRTWCSHSDLVSRILLLI
jgi:hypothetical protein